MSVPHFVLAIHWSRPLFLSFLRGWLSPCFNENPNSWNALVAHGLPVQQQESDKLKRVQGKRCI
jgi:hypothetical protein